MKEFLFSLLSIITGICEPALGAPFPGAPSSVLSTQSWPIPFPSKGFSISNAGTDWNLKRIEKSTDEELDLELSPSDPLSSASLKLNTNTVSKKMSLEDYSKQFLTEYSSLGFELLGTQSFKHNASPGLVMDLLHKKEQKKVRQIFFMKEKTVVQITCQNDLTAFQKYLPDCNRWVKNFTWLEKSQ